MSQQTYFTDHWQDIDETRMSRYEQMFVWRDGHASMLAPLDLKRGSRVVDYGCGPGFTSVGMASIVGVQGHVYGVDLNEQFVERASKRAKDIENVSFHLLTQQKVPLAENVADRLLCKNVLEYVPDVSATLSAFRSVLEPGGRLLVIDSDWRFVIVEPWGASQTARFFDAASVAFKTPEIGRQLRKLLTTAGFTDVEVEIRAGVDTAGGSLSVLRNMATYATAFESMAESETDELIATAQQAVETGEFLFSLPQFLVSAKNPD